CRVALRHPSIGSPVLVETSSIHSFCCFGGVLPCRRTRRASRDQRRGRSRRRRPPACTYSACCLLASPNGRRKHASRRSSQQCTPAGRVTHSQALGRCRAPPTHYEVLLGAN